VSGLPPAGHGHPAGLTRKIRIGLAGLGRVGRIRAASPSARCPSAQPRRIGADVSYTVKQESR
jgi:hypothetical protein